MLTRRFLMLIALLLVGCQSPPWTLDVTSEPFPSEVSELGTAQPQGSVLEQRTITHLILQGDVEGITLGQTSLKRVPIGDRTLAEATAYYQSQPGVEAVYPDLPAEALDAPDPNLGDQWGLFTTQAYPGLAGTNSIDCSNVTVGIVDSGVDLYHEDLQLAVEKVRNGLVTAKNYITPEEGNPYDVTDNSGHGTHVAGIIAATRNNGKGIAGLTNCKILPVKALGANNQGEAFDIISGIKYAVDNGARVVNLSVSLGVTYIYPPMQEALTYAANKTFSVNGVTATGSVIVVAAGNNGSAVVCPANDPATIAVSSVSQFAGPASGNYWEFLSSFSSRGDRIDVSAPGGRILSTIPSNKYASMSGTSMAAPHVSAMAALILAKHPTWSATQVKERICSAVDDLGAPGKDPMYGYGRINLLKAVQ